MRLVYSFYGTDDAFRSFETPQQAKERIVCYAQHSFHPVRPQWGRLSASRIDASRLCRFAVIFYCNVATDSGRPPPPAAAHALRAGGRGGFDFATPRLIRASAPNGGGFPLRGLTARGFAASPLFFVLYFAADSDKKQKKRALSNALMEPTGIEPATSGLQSRRSPN